MHPQPPAPHGRPVSSHPTFSLATQTEGNQDTIAKILLNTKILLWRVRFIAKKINNIMILTDENAHVEATDGLNASL
jgi:hypothetical protein